MSSQDPRKTRCQVAQELFVEFCANTTIHGVRFFVEKGRHWLERFWWVIMFVLSTCVCTYIILNVHKENRKNPVNLSLENVFWPLSSVPFPAVTICPTKKIDKQYFENAAFARVAMAKQYNDELLKHLSPEDLNRIDAMSQVCQRKLVLNNISGILRTESIYETIKNMRPDAFSVVQDSFFRDDLVYFQPIFTGCGLCFTFNSLDSRDLFSDEVDAELITVQNNQINVNWYMENGYLQGAENVYPHRVLESGLKNGLSAKLSTTADETDRYCIPISPTFTIALHTPDALPHFPDDFVIIPLQHQIYIQIKPSAIITTKHLQRNHPPEMRGCVLKSERKLRFFKSYLQHNCHMECLANFTNSMCGCVKFFMPRDKHTKVCTMTDEKCYAHALKAFAIYVNEHKCQCLPDCFAIKYKFDILQFPSPVGFEGAKNASSIDAESELFVSFQKDSFVPIRVSVTQTLFDFIADCGGLLNLFMGVSMLSVIELIHYFTIRLAFELGQLQLIEMTPFTWLKQKYLVLRMKIAQIR